MVFYQLVTLSPDTEGNPFPRMDEANHGETLYEAVVNALPFYRCKDVSSKIVGIVKIDEAGSFQTAMDTEQTVRNLEALSQDEEVRHEYGR